MPRDFKSAERSECQSLALIRISTARQPLEETKNEETRFS
jgi:hypothetical protein